MKPIYETVWTGAADGPARGLLSSGLEGQTSAPTRTAPAPRRQTPSGPSYGATRQMCLAYIAEHPGSTVRQIADAHPGTRRKSISSAVNKMYCLGWLTRYAFRPTLLSCQRKYAYSLKATP